MTETNSVENMSLAGGGKVLRLKKFGFLDFFVIVLCVSGAVLFFNLFYQDLFRSIAFLDREPVGTVTIRQNNVQRRLIGRGMWDRLVIQSPVFQGDLIRVAEHSMALLSVQGSDIDLGANTLIRIILAADEEGRVLIDLDYGSMNVAGGGVAVTVMDRLIAPAQGTVFSLQADEDGMEMQVSEGAVYIMEEGGGLVRFVETGGVLTVDSAGVEWLAPTAVMLYPGPTSRFLQTGGDGGRVVDFRWHLVNTEPLQPVRLQIARDRNFSYIEYDAVYFQNHASVNLAAGMWHWRLVYQESVLRGGHFTVVNATVQSLVSPVQDSVLPYTGAVPAVRFEWLPVGGVTHYVFQASPSADFSNPVISRQVASAFFVEQNMAEGRWYWRVKPVFPPFFLGEADFSPTGSFGIERAEAGGLAVLEEAEMQRLYEVVLALMLPPEPPQVPPPEPVLLPVPVQPVPAPPVPVPAVFVVEEVVPPTIGDIVMQAVGPPALPPTVGGIVMQAVPPVAGGVVMDTAAPPAAVAVPPASDDAAVATATADVAVPPVDAGVAVPPAVINLSVEIDEIRVIP
ncbi:MAG: hypothetical protein FWG66_05075 [Spirochaetes bacterium]|nr:hypothetical protein [Spirochaetota bacterium]